MLGLVGGLLGGVGSLLGGIFGGRQARKGQESANTSNLKIARETNLSNERLQQMANEANIAMVNSANDANALLAKENREFQADFSRENREWEKAWEIERATNAHQWAMQDLKAAGLNPILAAQQGAQTGGINANAVSQQAPTMQAARVEAATHQRAEVQNAHALSSQIYAASAKEIFGMVASAKRLGIEERMANSQEGLNSALAAKSHSDAAYTKRELQVDLPGVQRELNIANANQMRAQEGHIREMIKHTSADIRKTEKEIKRIEEDIEYTKAMKNKAYSEIRLNTLNEELIAANTRLAQANVANVYLGMAIAEMGIPEKMARAEIADSVRWVHDKTREGFSFLPQIGSDVAFWMRGGKRIHESRNLEMMRQRIRENRPRGRGGS